MTTEGIITLAIVIVTGISLIGMFVHSKISYERWADKFWSRNGGKRS